MSFQIFDGIILNHREKVFPNKPSFQYAEPLKPHPGVFQQNANLVTAHEMFHGVTYRCDVLYNSYTQQYHLSVSAA